MRLLVLLQNRAGVIDVTMQVLELASGMDEEGVEEIEGILAILGSPQLQILAGLLEGGNITHR
jgi:hypothetical protein